MAISLSPSRTQQQPPEIGPDELFVSGVIARADIEAQTQMDLGHEIGSVLQTMLPDIRQVVREERGSHLMIKVIVAYEVFKAPRAPAKKHMG